MRGFIISILLLGFTTGTFAQNLADNAIEVEAKGSYLMGVGTSKQLARQLAIFEAKSSALETAGKYLTHKSLIPFYEMKKALEMACRLGKNVACDDLRRLKKVHNLDLAP